MSPELLTALGAATPTTLAVGAVIYLFRELRKTTDARLEDLKQILPLTTKLVSCVEIVERLTNAQLGKGA